MMESFIRTLLGVSLTGGIFILAAVLVRSGVKRHLPKHFLVLLWAAVLVHLLPLPELPSPASIYNYVAFRGPVDSRETAYAVPSSVPGIEKKMAESVPSAAGAYSEKAAEGERFLRALFYVWSAGAAAFLIIFAGSHVIAMKRFGSAFLLKNNPAVDRWLKRRKHPLKVFVSDRATTPLSYGLLSPRIILPRSFDFSDAAQVESVLEHEYAHGSNRHNVMKALVYLSLVLHWFNPLVWLYWLLFNHDLELACDERVIGAIGSNRRAEYAYSLVAVAERAAVPFPLVSAFGARNLKERIVDVMGYRRTTASLLVMEVLLVVCLFALFGTTAVTGGTNAVIVAPASDAETAAFAMPQNRSYPEGMEPAAAALSFTGGGVVIKQEIEIGKRGMEHEFRILSGNQEYSVKIDPRMRSVVEFERKTAKREFDEIEYSRFISMERAVQTARESVAHDGAMSECELKRVKPGRFVYLVEISADGREYEVTIDAVSGRELSVKADSP